MPAIEKEYSDKVYLSIVGGDFSQKVEEGTPNAVRREYKLKNGTQGVKYEIIHKGWFGIIRDIKLKQTDFGEVVNVFFDDAIVSIQTDSRYFSDFAKKIMSANLEEKIFLSPFDFESDDGKRIIGMSVIQNGTKLTNYYWDTENEKPTNGFPEPEGNTSSYSKDDWKIFFIGVKKFLLNELEKLEFSDKVEEHEVEQPQEEEIPIIQVEDEEEVKVEDVPF